MPVGAAASLLSTAVLKAKWHPAKERKRASRHGTRHMRREMPAVESSEVMVREPRRSAEWCGRTAPENFHGRLKKGCGVAAALTAIRTNHRRRKFEIFEILRAFSLYRTTAASAAFPNSPRSFSAQLPQLFRAAPEQLPHSSRTAPAQPPNSSRTTPAPAQLPQTPRTRPFRSGVLRTTLVQPPDGHSAAVCSPLVTESVSLLGGSDVSSSAGFVQVPTTAGIVPITAGLVPMTSEKSSDHLR